ncbi:hypothetical protein LSH36_377g00009 [Paralvinella palmiformis]|uniref:Peptidase M14 domain-containing protein n=1 Tax=Paralvinella palmiformis TaxID=53620 RepID=A0AAD9JEB5_9ANNE|nr:hypothetical protein LSH36_377g00009 [Paralvinella palmiformis]
MINVQLYGISSVWDIFVCAVSVVALTPVTATASSTYNYDRFQVFRIKFPTKEKWSEFYSQLPRSLPSDGNKTANIWRHPDTQGQADVLISGNYVDEVKRLLKELDLKHQVTIFNVGSVIGEEMASRKRRRKRSINDNDIIGHYARYHEMLNWMNDVVVHYPTITKIITIGKTEEGREMKMLKIGFPGSNKWKIWLDGGIHAREWIAPATVLYLADMLLQGYKRKDSYTTHILQKLDFYFLPVVNPDGYEYSQTKDRLWRKNRKFDLLTGCHGVDLNRNWRFQWGQGFSSDDPCADDYRGLYPEDSVEVQNIISFLSPRAQAFIAFLTYHSYGQRFITRWDYTKDAVPKDHNQLITLAQKAVIAMKRVHETVYEAGRAPELMYPYGGGSPDWAKAIGNIKYSYLIELRNHHSFILPTEQIRPTGEENWAALSVISRDIILYYGDIPAPHVGDSLHWSTDNAFDEYEVIVVFLVGLVDGDEIQNVFIFTSDIIMLGSNTTLNIIDEESFHLNYHPNTYPGELDGTD